MRSILVAVLGFTASTVYAASFAHHHHVAPNFEITNDFTACHKQCADELSFCLVKNDDPKSCFKKGNHCSLSCHEDLEIPKDLDSEILKEF